MAPLPQPSPARTRALAQRVLEIGFEIRARTEAAPFFGPRAAPEVQGKAWQEIDSLRQELEALLRDLCPDKPGLWPMYKLEAEGCGENFHRGMANALATLKKSEGPQGVPEALRAPLLEAELRVFLSRIDALRGESDPDHGLV